MRQSNTYTTKIEGKLVRTPRGLTKGKALIVARGILGPHAFGLLDLGGNPCIIGAQGQYQGPSWEQALSAAKESPEAQAWSDKQIEDSKGIALAVNAANHATTKYYASLQGPVREPGKIHSRGSWSCGSCDRRISANKLFCLAHSENT